MKSFTSVQAALLAAIVLVIGIVFGYAAALNQKSVMEPGRPSRTPMSFEECVATGNPVMESYPRQCRAGGKTFVEKVTPPPAPPSQPPSDPRAKAGCQVGGCSGQACTDASEPPAITTCEYRAEYACYKVAACERQSDGKCGWTQTAEFKACLNNPPPML